MRWGMPNPDTPGTSGPLGRPKTLPSGNTPQTKALIAYLEKKYPGIHISSYRTPDQQESIRTSRGAKGTVWVGSKYGTSHVWGTAIDASRIRDDLRERFKADVRAMGLRAYDEGSHVHVDDRTDLPDGPMERKRKR